MNYLLAHDLGTSGNKAVLYSEDGKLIYSCTKNYGLKVENANHCEQSADDWWNAVVEVTREVTKKVDPKDIACVSFSGQMMGCLCVDKNGDPLRNALIWADMRSTKEEAFIKSNISMWDFYKITGHRISASYGGAKMMWIKENEPDVYSKTYKFLNAKDYIILKLTGEFVTEYTDASSTTLWDIKNNKWSKELISLSRLDPEKFPLALPSTAVAGRVTSDAARITGLLEGTPVVCGGGDGVCSAIGTAATRTGLAHSCMGTSSWLAVTSNEPVEDPMMLINTWPHIVPNHYLPFGTMQCGGGAYNWAVKTLYKVDPQPFLTSTGEAIASPIGAKGLLFLPYLIGERSPRWNPEAKGVFAGLTLEHQRGDMMRAVMEGVALNLGVILSRIKEFGCNVDNIVTVGGGANNDLWRRIFADVYNVRIQKPDNVDEATSMGAAITGGVGIGIFDSFEVANNFFKIQDETLPDIQNHEAYKPIADAFEACYEQMIPVFTKLSSI